MANTPKEGTLAKVAYDAYFEQLRRTYWDAHEAWQAVAEAVLKAAEANKGKEEEEQEEPRVAGMQG